MPCSPTDVNLPLPIGSGALPIPPFGTPFSVPVPSLPFPDSFPEDLLSIFDKLQFLLPSGALKPALNPNAFKDIFDGIMDLLNQFMPVLMLYKLFLPLLNLVICIIEVLCALMNPFALVSAINRLFTQCLPQFLSLFPIFALILMIISLLLLLLALIEYIIGEIAKLIKAILRNISALNKAFNTANSTAVLAIAKKLASLLCLFQNLFVLLAFFGIIIQVFKDILSLVFTIPPCESNSNSGCCGPNTCPAIVQTQYTNTTGTLQYLNEVGVPIPGISLPGVNSNVDVRTESWQLFDTSQTLPQQFQNIVDGYDVTQLPKPVFFPTDANYSATTAPRQVAYTVDLRLFYNPASWGRPGTAQFIRFKDCIVLFAPTTSLKIFDNSSTFEPTGVFYLAGGSGFLDDNTTPIDGYASDGVTPINAQATLENLLHFAPSFSSTPVLLPTDGYTFTNMQYTFKPNLDVLLQKNLVTLGCEPAVALNRAFVNNVVFASVAAQTADLKALVTGPNFPDPTATQACLLASVSALRTNMTIAGVAEFQTTTGLCLSSLQNNTKSALASLVGIGFAPCKSNFTLTPSTQFTTLPIVITVNLNENNGLPITTGLPVDIAADLADQLKAFPTFGTASNFVYDGYQAFTANITSKNTGSGSVMVSFQNQILCTNILPADGTTPSHTLQSLDYKFVYSPVSGNIPPTGEGDVIGIHPRRSGGE